MNPLLPFYLGAGHDSRGRSLADVLVLSDKAKEDAHDYIHWLFPLFDRSAAVPSSPRLDESVVRSFRSDPVVRRNMRRALETMLRFYGLELRDIAAQPQVVRAANFAVRAPVWISPGTTITTD